MGHYAKIENDIVTRVIRIDNEHESNAHYFINVNLGLKGEWIQTSYNNKIRKRFAGLGDIYHREGDVFLKPKPYPSWVLNSEWEWLPANGKMRPSSDNELISYDWSEDAQDWIEHYSDNVAEPIQSGSI